ncbi:MAG: glutamate racemase [Kiritimatiellae bacterium]|nr:glutamate racemase [Kiritimatiellia bacterium]
MNPNPTAPIGFFDSGIGGLSVWRAVAALLPRENTVYFADSANCPYGNKPIDEIVSLALRHTRTLLDAGCKLIVVACNTATAGAIDTLRATLPDVPFVGMEPAVKPASLRSRTGVVGVLATEGTFHGRLYRETCARFAKETTVLMCVADAFVTLVECGETSGEHAEQIVRQRVEPLLDAGADYLVLGCTHFPFLAPLIQKVAAGRAEVLDPAPAVARQVERLLRQRGLLNPSEETPTHIFRSSRPTPAFHAKVAELTAIPAPCGRRP